MNQHQETVLANNILEFLIDPTRFPVKQRVYFRPEEILRNESYEDAKADSYKAYKDQKKNSDFYPSKNRPSREAFIMDRKTVIASLDVLAQHFFNENDPMATDLRTIAHCVSKLTDEEYGSRLASTIEAKGKAETVPCPKCGTKILKQTGYCLKCKEKVLGAPKKEEEADAEASTELWTKEAASAVQEALVSDVIGNDDEDVDDAPAPKKDDAPAPAAPKEDEKKPAPKIEAKKEEAVPPAVEDEKPVEKEAKKEEKEEKAPVVPVPEEKQATEPKKIVDTNILAFDGIEMEASMQEAGELSAEEQSRLNQLFQ